MRSLPLLIIAGAICCLPQLPAQVDNNAGDLFLKCFTLKSEAEQLEKSGDAAGALAKYTQAQQIIGVVAANFPSWQPEVVGYRQRLIEHSINRIQQRTGIMAQPQGGNGADPYGNMSAPAQAWPQAQPQMPAPAYAQPQGYPQGQLPPTAPPTQQQQQAMASPLQYLDTLFRNQAAQIEESNRKLRMYEDGYTNALRDRSQLQQDVVLLNQQLQDLSIKADAVAKDANSKKAASEKEVKKLQDEIKMVNGLLNDRKDMLMSTGKALEDMEKEKEELHAKIKKLEDDNAKQKREGIKKDDYDRILAENTRLKQELETARVQVESLKVEGGKKDQEIASLRTQITTIQGEVAKLRQENTAYQGQVAELTLKLKEVNAQIAAMPAPAPEAKPDPEAEKALAENKALRNIIMRQLRTQQRQQQAKEIVMTEMKKMEGLSQTLIDNLEDITNSRIRITLDEEVLFSEPELKELLQADTGVYGTLQASASPAAKKREKEGEADKEEAPAKVAATAMDKKEDTAASAATEAAAKESLTAAPAPVTLTNASVAEATLMNRAKVSLEGADYKSAEWAYQDALRANPKNTLALVNLAGLKLRAHQYDEAEVLLQKCLVYSPNNDTALHRLGICYFQQGRLSEAISSFEKSLAQQKSNARAHHYLGIITSRQGNRTRAETEFKSALAIDPAYGDAHFNLAVLYATSSPPDWSQARKHYQDALSRGIKADPAMDRLLGQESPMPNMKDKKTAAAH